MTFMLHVIYGSILGAVYGLENPEATPQLLSRRI